MSRLWNHVKHYKIIHKYNIYCNWKICNSTHTICQSVFCNWFSDNLTLKTWLYLAINMATCKIIKVSWKQVEVTFFSTANMCNFFVYIVVRKASVVSFLFILGQHELLLSFSCLASWEHFVYIQWWYMTRYRCHFQLLQRRVQTTTDLSRSLPCFIPIYFSCELSCSFGPIVKNIAFYTFVSYSAIDVNCI